MIFLPEKWRAFYQPRMSPILLEINTRGKCDQHLLLISIENGWQAPISVLHSHTLVASIMPGRKTAPSGAVDAEGGGRTHMSIKPIPVI
jgi:hypothetical protein